MQNAICKTRAQHAKRYGAFEQFKVHCAATNNAKNATFQKNFKVQLFRIRKLLII
jgi:hypothetical protein